MRRGPSASPGTARRPPRRASDDRLRNGWRRAANRISSEYALPIPATNAWLRSRFLSSPGCFRIRSRQASRVSPGRGRRGPSRRRPRPGTGRSTPAGQEVDLAHLGGVAVADRHRRIVGRQPAGAARSTRPHRPARRPGRAARGPAPGRPRSAAFSPRPASWNRPVSIGLTTTRSRSRSRSRNLPARATRATRWPTSASSSAGVPRTASGMRRPGARQRAAPRGRRGGRRRRRRDRAARARARDCTGVTRGARLARPMGTDS